MKEIRVKTLKERFISGSFCSLLFKLAGAFLGLVVYGLLARMLSVDEFGMFLLVVSITTFIATVVQAGMSKTALKLIAEALAKKNHERASHVLRYTLRFILVFGAFTISLWSAGANDLVSLRMFQSPKMAELGWLTACWFVLFAVLRYFSESFCVIQDFLRSNFFSGTATSMFSVSIFGIYYLNHWELNLHMAVMVTLLSTLLAVIVAGVMLNRRIPLKGKTRLVHGAEIWPIAWPVLFANLTVFVGNQADLWILGIFVPKEELALYGAALRTILLITLAPMIINSVVQPMIVELYSQGEKRRLERLLRTTAAATFVPSVCLLIAVIFAGDYLLGFVFGQEFTGGALVLTILCSGRTVAVFSGSCGQCLMLGGYQRAMMITSLIFVLMSVTFALITVNQYGIIGVATSFAVGTVLQNLTQAMLVRYKMGVSTFASFSLIKD